MRGAPLTTQKPVRPESLNGLGTPLGDAQVSPEEIRDDAGATLRHLGRALPLPLPRLALSGAGVAGVAAGLAAMLLWRRHQRANRFWPRARRAARTAAHETRAKSGIVGGRAADAGTKAVRAARAKAGR